MVHGAAIFSKNRLIVWEQRIFSTNQFKRAAMMFSNTLHMHEVSATGPYELFSFASFQCLSKKMTTPG